MKPLAALLTASLLCASAFAADAPATPKADLEKGQAKFGEVCIACHGADGNSGSDLPLQPRLAQQHPEYVLKQLTELKSGVREDPIMLPMASLLTDEDMHNVAAWLATQKATPPGAVAADPALVAQGQRIYRGGIADRRIPACAGCHSPNGAGIPSQYPRLSGQHPEYTVKQLTAFRDGTRTNNPSMTDVAAKLNDREIKAVADYIAGLH